MSNRINHLLHVSMEQEDLSASAAVPETSADEALLNAKDAEAEVTATTESLLLLNEAAASLETIALALEECREGLSPQAAYYANVAISRASSMAGLPASACISSEAFTPSQAVQATSLSLESVQSTLVAVLEKIKAMYIHIRRAIGDFLQRLFDVAPKLQARAVELMEKGRALKGSPSELHFDDEPLARQLAINTEVEERPTQALQELSHLADDFIGDNGFGAAMTKLATGLGQLATSLNSTDTNFDSKILTIFKYQAPMPKTFTQSKKSDDGVDIKATDVLPGGKIFVLQTARHNPEGGVKGAKQHAHDLATKFSFSVQDFAERGTVKPGLQTLTGGEIVNTMALVNAILGKVSDYQGVKRQDDKTRQTTLDSFDSLAKHVWRVDDSEHTALIATLFRAFGEVDRVGNTSIAKMAGYLTQISRSYIAYAEKSMALYATKAEPASTPAEDVSLNLNHSKDHATATA